MYATKEILLLRRPFVGYIASSEIKNHNVRLDVRYWGGNTSCLFGSTVSEWLRYQLGYLISCLDSLAPVNHVVSDHMFKVISSYVGKHWRLVHQVFLCRFFLHCILFSIVTGGRSTRAAGARGSKREGPSLTSSGASGAPIQPPAAHQWCRSSPYIFR